MSTSAFTRSEKAPRCPGLAEKIGSHRDHIGRLERGDVANFRMSTIKKLAEALEVDPAELVGS
jgi:DNA-binding Xre family transcriptional regulator